MDVKKLHDSLDNLKALIAEVSVLKKNQLKMTPSLVPIDPQRIIDLEDLTTNLINRVGELEDMVYMEPADTPEPLGTDTIYAPEKCGINIPYLDFGDDIISHPQWGKKSLAASEEKQVVLYDLMSVTKAEGFGTVRFWLFPSFWHTNGKPYTQDHTREVAESVDILCRIAKDAGVKLIPTLLSFDNYSMDKRLKWNALEPYEDGSQTGPLIGAALSALSKHGDVIDYVDIMNEPEWCTEGIPDADPQRGKMNVVDASKIRETMTIISDACKLLGLRTGYGAASLKWARADLLPSADVEDFHAYPWSNEWFPPENVGDDSGFYMGETHEPFSEWGKYFTNNKYAKVLLWLEPSDYTVKTDNGAYISGDALRTTLQNFKGT